MSFPLALHKCSLKLRIFRDSGECVILKSAYSYFFMISCREIFYVLLEAGHRSRVYRFALWQYLRDRASFAHFVYLRRLKGGLSQTSA